MERSGGYVKLFRKSIQSDVFDDPIVWKVWCWCLMKATHKPMTTILVGQVIKLQPGQFITGRFEAKKELTKVSIRQWRRAIDVLSSTERIMRKPTNKFTLITVVKWAHYQVEEEKTANKRPTNGQQTATYKKYKNIKKEREVPASQALLAKNKEMKANKIGSYREDMSSDYYETAIDMDTGQVVIEPKSSPNISKVMKELLVWSENRSGHKFVNRGKQFKAMKLMREAGRQPAEIKARWVELENQEFYKRNGMDFMSVANSFDKK